MVSFKHEADDKRGKIVILEDEIPAGEISYVWSGTDKFIIEHTEAYDGFSGKGYAKKLVMKAVDYAIEKSVKIIPMCTYAHRVLHGDPSLQHILFN